MLDLSVDTPDYFSWMANLAPISLRSFELRGKIKGCSLLEAQGGVEESPQLDLPIHRRSDGRRFQCGEKPAGFHLRRDNVTCVGGTQVQNRPLSFHNTSSMAACWSTRFVEEPGVRPGSGPLLPGPGRNRSVSDGPGKLVVGRSSCWSSLHLTDHSATAGQSIPQNTNPPG